VKNLKQRTRKMPKSEERGTKGGKSHWKSAVDARTGRMYYYHEVTRETQWRKPMELASDEERRAMENKEQKQKDFFAAMEANILNSISQGVVPGTPLQGGGGCGSGGSTSLNRRKSSRKVSLGPDGRLPELVRTISTMDESFLRDLIRRQPSFRTMRPNVSKEDSLRAGDLAVSSRTASCVRDGFDSWSHSSHNKPLETLEESQADFHCSMPELFSYLPDEEHSVDLSNEGGNSSFRSDGGKFNESSITGFGLTWEETQALRKLASITKEMIDADAGTEEFELEDEAAESDLKANIFVGTTPSSKLNDEKKEKRNLPREIEFDDESEFDHGTPTQAPAFLKATEGGGGRALPRELDFEDSDDEETRGSDRATTPRKDRAARMLANSGKKAEDLLRPEVKRRNTCGTLYVGSTMSAPDKDATIKVCIQGLVGYV
jgi:hypothetical protein